MIQFLLLSTVALQSSAIETIEVIGGKNLLASEPFTNVNIEHLGKDDLHGASNTIADWIVQVPGVSLNGQGGLYQSYSIRGLSRWRVRTEVNGIVLLTDRRAGNSASFIDPGLLQLASVQKGPAAMLYGSEAIGGVISMNSVQGEQKTLELGVEDTGNGRRILAITGEENYNLAFAYRKKNSSHAPNGDELNNGFEQFSSSIRYNHQLADDIELNMSWLPSVSKEVGKNSVTYPENQIAMYPEDLHSLAQVSVKSDQWLVNVFHHYQNWDSDVQRIGKRHNLTEYQSHTLGANLYHEFNWDNLPMRAGLDWTARRGVSITDQETNLKATASSTFNTLLDGQQDNFAAFINGIWEQQSWRADFGTRFDHFTASNFGVSKSDTHLSHSLGLSKQWQAHSMSLNYANAFRFPTLTELYFNGVTPRGNTIGNPHLDPETSQGLELTYRVDSQQAQTTLSLFHTRLDDYIERVKLASGDRTYLNLDQASISGAEISTQVEVSDALSYTLGYTHQKGESDTGDYLSDIAPRKLSLSGRYAWQSFEFKSALNYQLAKHQPGSGETDLDKSLVVDFNVNWFVDEHWTLRAGVLNLFNRLYRTTADEDAPFHTERTIKFDVSWTI
ncbi:TonB-dependent receptor [Pseudoalteromonas sp. DL2-H2.2]|uniref:TonB-dependent receptor n=1 Tax=Pseudoalteromonas sp. DL2-H2.2 TaxID=2908889 RepID=UPI001F1DFF38|nr:TonB-dependent receptor [Pseudoalteromonas sp. DL2-H2.2]MCF2906818.1 TonB-dependent receptor [Pseudoalteromonas sp. DL2-H2.2]